MPLYTFKDEAGEEWELFFHMMEVPSIGDSVRMKGHVFTRLPPKISPPQTKFKKPYKAYSQPALDRDGNLPPGAVRAPRYDPTDGVAIFASESEEKEYMAKSEGNVTKDD